MSHVAMHISIHSIQSTLFEGEAEKVIAATPQGQMTVLDRHLPLISRINGPSVTITARDGRQSDIPLAGGFLEVRPGSRVVILAEV